MSPMILTVLIVGLTAAVVVALILVMWRARETPRVSPLM
jgi:hypothetical protein